MACPVCGNPSYSPSDVAPATNADDPFSSPQAFYGALARPDKALLSRIYQAGSMDDIPESKTGILDALRQFETQPGGRPTAESLRPLLDADFGSAEEMDAYAAQLPTPGTTPGATEINPEEDQKRRAMEEYLSRVKGRSTDPALANPR